MKLFGIRHKPSGRLMPQLKGRGFTGLNFHADGFEKEFAKNKLRVEPRLFAREIGARRALAAWLKGEWKPEYSAGDYYSDSELEGHFPPSLPPADRIATDMEIVEFRLTEQRNRQS